MLARFAPSFALGLLALFACAAPRRAESQALRAEAGSYELEVLVDGVAATSFVHEGETHVLGEQGRRYVLRVHNRSGQRVEAVVSVDGLDVIDGKSADFARKRGYLVPAHGFVDIEGFRTSEREVATFRFAAVADSYAAKTGRARDVGVIGVAVFPERVRRPVLAYPSVSSSRHSFDAESAPRSSAPAKAEQPAPTAAPSAPDALGGRAEASRAPASGGASGASLDRSYEHKRRGLGTEFGEARSSEIREVAFERARATRPAVVLGARYDDRAGLIALGIDVDGELRDAHDLALRRTATPFPSSPRRFATPPQDWRNF